MPSVRFCSSDLAVTLARDVIDGFGLAAASCLKCGNLCPCAQGRPSPM
jgi:hypothetical protein